MGNKPVKFASQLDPDILDELKTYAKEADRSISGVVNEAVKEYLAKVRVRPAFLDAAEQVMADNEELLRRLAK